MIKVLIILSVLLSSCATCAPPRTKEDDILDVLAREEDRMTTLQYELETLRTMVQTCVPTGVIR